MRNKLLTLLIGVSLVVTLVAVPLMTACAPEVEVPEVEVPEVEVPEVEVPEVEVPEVEVPEVAPKVIKIGWLNALTGPYTLWTLPSLTGTKIWVDDINAAGGLKVGDDTYLVELVTYDSECLPDKALLGAKKLVLEDGVDLMLPGWGEGLAAVQPFLHEHKILNLNQDPRGISPDYPYNLSCAGMHPTMYGVAIQYIVDTYPEITTAAVLTIDTLPGLRAEAWYMAPLEANNIDVVYRTLYSWDAIDFAPIVSAMMANDPDLVLVGSPMGGQTPLIFEQLYLQGFDGIIHVSEILISDVIAKVSIEWLEARKCVAGVPDWDDPALPEACNDFYADWMARFGPGGPEDVHRSFFCMDWFDWVSLKVWQWAVETCGSVDSTIVRDFLMAQETIPHAMGPAAWWGEELYGANNDLIYLHPMTEIIGGKNVVVDMRSVSDWWEEGTNKDFIVNWYIDNGLMWWQLL